MGHDVSPWLPRCESGSGRAKREKKRARQGEIGKVEEKRGKKLT